MWRRQWAGGWGLSPRDPGGRRLSPRDPWGGGAGHWLLVLLHVIHLSAQNSVPPTKMGISGAGGKPCPSRMLGQALEENKKCPGAPAGSVLTLEFKVQAPCWV